MRRRLRFPDFVRAFGRATQAGLVAEAEGHHPEMTVGWGYLEIESGTREGRQSEILSRSATCSQRCTEPLS
jgi:pterin-4a-carbinolamine dehydratase